MNIAKVDVGSQEQTLAGMLIRMMYYNGFLAILKQGKERRGFPHNGGSHTLTLYLSAEDLEAFLALVREHFASLPGLVDAFLRHTEQAVQKLQ